jgi:hypothetical protein
VDGVDLRLARPDERRPLLGLELAPMLLRLVGQPERLGGLLLLVVRLVGLDAERHDRGELRDDHGAGGSTGAISHQSCRTCPR